ncbi:MAG: transglutaminase TgpA family protein [Gammaproteobacteria bacterium]
MNRLVDTLKGLLPNREASGRSDLPALNQFWIIVTLGLILAPHLGRLPLWLSVLMALPFVVRLVHLYRPLPMPGLILRFLLVCVAFAGVFMQYGTTFGRTGGSALLAIMAAFKLFELEGRRDLLFLILLGYFLVVVNMFFDQSIPTAALMLFITLVISAQLVALEDLNRPRLDSDKLRLAGRLMLQGLPIMLVLFVLFPRLDSPLWRFSLNDTTARTGLSEDMRPGSFSNLILSDEVAFRVDFHDATPPPSQLYWRAAVLWHYDGTRWTEQVPFGDYAQRFQGQGPRYEYTMTMEPTDKRWLFALDLPTAAPEDAHRTPDYVLRSKRNITAQHRYTLGSYTRYSGAGKRLQPNVRRAALRLPQDLAPKAKALAALWREELGDDARAIAGRALNWFRESGFRYTLTPPILEIDPIDEFLFETREGFCEHYSSAFVVLMRAAGIPARVVVGYQGGESNPMGDYMIVRQSDAHAWSEIWAGEDGWVRVDPTGAISPGRIDGGISGALPESTALPLMARPDRLPWLRSVRLAWDAVNNSWNQWVIGYETARQLRLLRALGLDAIGGRDLVIALGISLTAILALIAAVVLRPRPGGRLSAAEKLFQRYERALRRFDIHRPPHEGPLDFAERVACGKPALAHNARQFARLYAQEHYGRRSDPSRLGQMRKLLRAVRV